MKSEIQMHVGGQTQLRRGKQRQETVLKEEQRTTDSNKYKGSEEGHESQSKGI